MLWNIARTPDTGVPVAPVAAIDQAAHDDAADARLLPASDGVATVAEKLPEPAVAEAESEGAEPLRAPDTLRQKGQLSGVVESGQANVAAIDQAAHDDAGDARLLPASDEVATVAEKLPEPAVAEAESEGAEPLRTPDTLRQKWQLSGVVQSGGAHIVLLTDPSDSSTRRVTAEIDVDGWLVKDAGRDYAVLAKNGEEVRLQLSK